MDKTIFDSLWNTLRKGKVWRNKLKNKAKNGESLIWLMRLSSLYSMKK